MKPRASQPRRTQPPGMLHNLGAFFGHVIRGVKTPATPPPRVIREEVREHPVDLPEGRVLLRRVIRDEVLPVKSSPTREPPTK